ncbi:MAG: OmpA family protein [Proteobacteria bacterium]|nr:OmpA family protein [Pseudomonadota bacterium]
MNSFRFSILCFLVLLPTSSLAGMVGGTCTYETLYGTAQIVEQEHGQVMARFKPGKQQFHNSDLPLSRFLTFPVQMPIAGEVGAIYPATLSIITKGSCPPSRAKLLATEAYSMAIFIAIDGDGSLTQAPQPTLKQLAIIFKELAPRWPQLTLDICGQTQPEGSEEYNLNLGDHHARQIAQLLEQQGVPAAQIKTSSYGEHPCPGSTAIEDELQNGAWLSFVLTSPASKKTEKAD